MNFKGSGRDEAIAGYISVFLGMVSRFGGSYHFRLQVVKGGLPGKNSLQPQQVWIRYGFLRGLTRLRFPFMRPIRLIGRGIVMNKIPLKL
jgi:hypothetical protein